MKGLKLVKGCGDSNRPIYIVEGSDKIQIGCTSYTKQDAIKAIKEKYRGSSQLEYINKVNECYSSDVTPWSILKGIVGDDNWKTRRVVAKHGQYLEQFKDDPSWVVRMEVAKQGKYLEQLKDDEDWRVRLEVVKQGKYLEHFKNDLSGIVRLEVSKHGKYLEHFKYDENYAIRMEAFKQGKYLERLKRFIRNLNIQEFLKLQNK